MPKAFPKVSRKQACHLVCMSRDHTPLLQSATPLHSRVGRSPGNLPLYDTTDPSARANSMNQNSAWEVDVGTHLTCGYSLASHLGTGQKQRVGGTRKTRSEHPDHGLSNVRGTSPLLPTPRLANVNHQGPFVQVSQLSFNSVPEVSSMCSKTNAATYEAI